MISLASLTVDPFTDSQDVTGEDNRYTMMLKLCMGIETVAPFTKEMHLWLAKRLLLFNGRLANRGLTSLVIEATPSIIITDFTSCKITALISYYSISILYICLCYVSVAGR